MQKSRIDADLRAKARIDWIQKVREASSSFLSTVLKLTGLINELEHIQGINSSEQKKVEDKIIDELNKFQEKRLLLKLYFGSNAENNKVVDDIEEINSYLSSLIEFQQSQRAQRAQQSQQDKKLANEKYLYYMNETKYIVEVFNETMRKYLKIEWDRAKNGE